MAYDPFSRIEQYKNAGSKDRSTSNRALGFVRFREVAHHVEGCVKELWRIDGREHPIVTMAVTDISAPVETKDGEETKQVEVKCGDLVYVGLDLADLRDVITEEDKGKYFLITYTGNKPVKRGPNKGKNQKVMSCLPVPDSVLEEEADD